MKNNKKIGEAGKKPPSNRIKQKPQFKQNNMKNKKKNNGQHNGQRKNQFTFAEEKRLDRIREQNERKAEKEAKQLLAQKEKKRKLKILAKKNSRGQPVMQGRMQLLLEKIEKRVGRK